MTQSEVLPIILGKLSDLMIGVDSVFKTLNNGYELSTTVNFPDIGKLTIPGNIIDLSLQTDRKYKELNEKLENISNSQIWLLREATIGACSEENLYNDIDKCLKYCFESPIKFSTLIFNPNSKFNKNDICASFERFKIKPRIILRNSLNIDELFIVTDQEQLGVYAYQWLEINKIVIGFVAKQKHVIRCRL